MLTFSIVFMSNNSLHAHLYLHANMVYSDFLIFLIVDTSTLLIDWSPSKHAKQVENSPIGYMQVLEKDML